MTFRLPALAGCLALCLCAGSVAAEEIATASREDIPALDLLRKLDEGFTSIFEQVAPSVVVIQVEKKQGADPATGLDGFDLFLRQQQQRHESFEMPRGPEVSEGSGFIIRADGYILTNNHVVEDAASIIVRLKDGREFKGKTVGADEKTDIAVLKVEASDLPAAPLGDSEQTRVGQLVFSIGVPYNLDFSFSGGWISAKGRTDLLKTTDPRVMYEDYIQTDAFINPGNSGGPLFDIEGRVIGMNSFINGIGRGLSFAIPSNMLRTVSEALITQGRVSRPWLGIRMLPDTEAVEEAKRGGEGVTVQTIYPDTPAYKSGLRPLDVITAVDGEAVKSTADMQKSVLRKNVGDTIRLTVLRNSERLEIPLETAELPAEPGTMAQESPGPEGEEKASTYGLQLQDLTPELQERLGLKVEAGALVSDIDEGSSADVADIRREDVITEINSNPVRDATQALQMLKEGDTGNGILLFLDRKGQKTYAVLKTAG